MTKRQHCVTTLVYSHKAKSVVILKHMTVTQMSITERECHLSIDTLKRLFAISL